MNTINNLDQILNKYSNSFSEKVYAEENEDTDILMDVFNITPSMKRENRQYWGRELGKCWESLIIEVCKKNPSFQKGLRINADEPCDLIIGNCAIDAKYRVGSGDSGTIKKFKAYADLLTQNGYTPVLLFLREDNLPSAMNACRKSGWKILIGKQSFDFIEKASGIALDKYLQDRFNSFPVIR